MSTGRILLDNWRLCIRGINNTTIMEAVVAGKSGKFSSQPRRRKWCSTALPYLKVRLFSSPWMWRPILTQLIYLIVHVIVCHLCFVVNINFKLIMVISKFTFTPTVICDATSRWIGWRDLANWPAKSPDFSELYFGDSLNQKYMLPANDYRRSE